jgi:hypothetical protein
MPPEAGDIVSLVVFVVKVTVAPVVLVRVILAPEKVAVTLEFAVFAVEE